jgi:hypothetical protein
VANTVFNLSDKSANLTLSGGNLIATTTSSALASVRSVDRQVAGKFYWEITCNTLTNSSASVGMATTAIAQPIFITGGAGPGTCGVNRAGSVYVDGVIVGGIAFGTIANGTVVGVAFDADARLVWFRLGAAGNWNMSATASPTTGAGGVAVFLGRGIPAHPAVCFAATSDQITANFGDTAFTGTVPSGFTSGFTAGSTIPTNALATQTAVEHWLSTNPDAQTTQVVLEQWATVTGTGLQALVTQVAIEQWASVASIGDIVPQNRVMVMA